MSDICSASEEVLHKNTLSVPLGALWSPQGAKIKQINVVLLCSTQCNECGS